MRSETISVIDVAKNLGKQKAHIFKILGRLGIETIKEKNSATKGQKISYITTEDYERIKEHLAGAENEPGVARACRIKEGFSIEKPPLSQV